MALIQCPECKNKISDKASRCPKCGYPIQTIAIQSQRAEQKPSFYSKHKKLFWLGTTIAIILIISILGIIVYSNSTLDKQEKYVLFCVDDLVDKTGKTAITLTNDILYYDREKNNRIYVIIEYTGPDGYDIAYYVDGRYQGKKSEYDADNHGDLPSEKVLAIAEANVAIAEYNVWAAAGMGYSDKCMLVDSAKIAKKLKIRSVK